MVAYGQPFREPETDFLEAGGRLFGEGLGGRMPPQEKVQKYSRAELRYIRGSLVAIYKRRALVVTQVEAASLHELWLM